jgi:hypothetical protein
VVARASANARRHREHCAGAIAQLSAWSSP